MAPTTYCPTRIGSLQIEDFRRQSFGDFSKENIDVETLIKSGFYYYNHGTHFPKNGALDKCVCRFCDVSVENFTTTEEAMKGHRADCSTQTNISSREHEGLYNFLSNASWITWRNTQERNPDTFTREELEKTKAESIRRNLIQTNSHFRSHCLVELVLIMNKNFDLNKHKIPPRLFVQLQQFLGKIEEDTYFMADETFKTLNHFIDAIVEKS